MFDKRIFYTILELVKKREYNLITQRLSLKDRIEFINNTDSISNNSEEDDFEFTVEDVSELMRNLFTKDEALKLIESNEYGLEFKSVVIFSLDDDYKIKFFKNNFSELDGGTLGSLLDSIEDRNKKINFLKENIQEFGSVAVSRLIELTNNLEEKKSLLNKYKDKLSLYEIFNIVLYWIDDINDKIELLEEYCDKFDQFKITSIIISINNDVERKKLLKKYIDKLNSSNIERIISNISDIEEKKKLIREYKHKLGEYDILTFFSKLNDSKGKLLLLEEFVNDDIITSLFNIVDIIKKTDDIEEKGDILRKFFNSGKIYSSDIVNIMKSIKNMEFKKSILEEFVYKGKLDSNSIGRIISDISDIEEKKILLEKYVFDDKLYPVDVAKIISSINNIDEKRILLKKYEDVLTSNDISSVICFLNNDEEKKGLLEEYSNKLHPSFIVQIINNISNIEERKMLLKKYINKFDSTNITDIILSINDLDEQKSMLKEYIDVLYISDIGRIISLIDDISDKLILLNSFDRFKELSVEDLFELNIISFNKVTGNSSLVIDKLSPVIDKYKNIEPSIAVLKSLIAIEAKRSFERKRDQDNNFDYLPSALPEILNNLAFNKQYSILIKDSEYLKYYNKMVSLVNESYNIKSITDILITISTRSDDRLFDTNDESYYSKKKEISYEDYLEEIKSKQDKSFSKMKEIAQEMGLDSISADECKLVAFLLNGLNIKNNLLKRAYFIAIKEVLNEENKSLSDLFLNISSNEGRVKQAVEFKKIFSLATEKVIKRAIVDERRSIDGSLLTQVSSYALNIEKQKEEKKENERLTRDIVKELVLTEKGMDRIYSSRMKLIIDRDLESSKIYNDNSINFKMKMELIFSKLYPQYIGKKDLKILYKLMSKDERFKEELTKPITLEEKLQLPIEKKCFKISKNIQQQKLIISILNYINKEKLDIGYYRLNSELEKRIDVLLNGIDLILKCNSRDARELGLLIFDDIDIVKSSNIFNLLLFYEHIMTSNSLIDKKLNESILNADNLEKYINRIKQISMLGTKYSMVLDDKFIPYIEERCLKENYEHYITETSKRFYRTIPSINGTFESDGQKLNYRSYEVDDPEQLIAGARMSKDVKASCFRIGHAQGETLKYITSSPNGIIVAIEDENGNFLGRVYGYRIGNAVHFTRMYYNVKFDFEKAIKGIGRDIINNSNEIDYVTCIPNTSINDEYISENLMYPPNDINISQEGKLIATDHNGRKISAVALRNPAVSIKFERSYERSAINEKFYKKRLKPKITDLSKFEDEKKVLNIIYRSNCSEDIIAQLNSAKQIVVGEDYVIIDDGEDIVPIIIDFKDNEESKKYREVVDREISSVILEMKRNKSNEFQLFEGLTEDELGQIREEVQVGGDRKR